MEQRIFTGSFKRRKRGLGFAALSWQRQTHTVFQKLDVRGVNFNSCVG
jgi:hypothetical protein